MSYFNSGQGLRREQNGIENEYLGINKCPFCGSCEAPVYMSRGGSYDNNDEIRFYVLCNSRFGGCDAQIGAGTKEGVIKKWNTRNNEKTVKGE